MIYLVQNGINDLKKVEETKRTIQNIFPKEKTTYLYIERKGSSAAINYVLGFTDADYLLFASSHSYYEEGYIDALLEEAEKDSRIGAIGGRTVCLPHDHSFQAVAVKDAFASFLAYFNRYRNYKKSERRIDNDRVYGAIYRIEAVKAAGNFDEQKQRGQDYDMVRRIRKRGYKSIVFPIIDVYLQLKERFAFDLLRRYYKQAFWSRRNREKRIPLFFAVLFAILVFSFLWLKIVLVSFIGVLCFLLFYSFLVSSNKMYFLYVFICYVSVYFGYFLGLITFKQPTKETI